MDDHRHQPGGGNRIQTIGKWGLAGAEDLGGCAHHHLLKCRGIGVEPQYRGACAVLDGDAMCARAPRVETRAYFPERRSRSDSAHTR